MLTILSFKPTLKDGVISIKCVVFEANLPVILFKVKLTKRERKHNVFTIRFIFFVLFYFVQTY